MGNPNDQKQGGGRDREQQDEQQKPRKEGQSGQSGQNEQEPRREPNRELDQQNPERRER